MSDESETFMSERLTHIDEQGAARMVDVSEKGMTKRVAVASAAVLMAKETLAAIREGSLKKGDVLAVARIAGINGAKATSNLVPLCHNIVLDKVNVDFSLEEEKELGKIAITAEAIATGKTGVEMEALTACSVAALTLYDMCKAIDKGMTIAAIRLERKEGGRSGAWTRD